MKHKIWKIIFFAFVAFAGIIGAQAQAIPSIIGNQITINGQSFLITTNSTGGFDVSTFGVSGTNVITAPASPSQAMQVVTAWVEANNPANAKFYATNEIEGRVFAGVIQNSGQAVAGVSVENWGWPIPNIGFGAGVLQGNDAGRSGTAGAFAEADYRKVIGDVAGVGGIMGGYDNWNKKGFIAAKVGAEYRQNAHLGEFVDVAYALETIKSDRGLLIFAGICYAF